jgi:hypothetical protein
MFSLHFDQETPANSLDVDHEQKKTHRRQAKRQISRGQISPSLNPIGFKADKNTKYDRQKDRKDALEHENESLER